MSDSVENIEEFLGTNGTLIVGGGIAGLYTAWQLSNRRSPVVVIEASDQWGGKIQTLKHGTGGRFVADYGPMRYELGVQPKLKKLLGDLGVGHDRFTGPLSPNVRWPDYHLVGDEEKLTTMELFRRGILLAIGEDGAHERAQAIIDGLWDEEELKYREVRNRTLRNESGTRRLRDMTLWNALSADGVLSHRAVMKIRELGSFYHMIDENVNAAEWIVWWLRASTTKGREMRTLIGGSSALTDALLRVLRQRSNLVSLNTGRRLLSYTETTGGQLQVNISGIPTPIPVPRLALALPRSGLLPLRSNLPAHISKDLDSVDQYGLLKVFFTVKNPWWTEEVPPQTNAASTPTREIHYQRQGDEGMVLVYTDRPASSYWQNYVKGETHDRPEIATDATDLKIEFARFLAEAVRIDLQRAKNGKAAAKGAMVLTDAARNEFDGFSHAELVDALQQRVMQTGIRDWGRAPFDGAYHAWKPGVISEAVIARLRRFGSAGRVHIVGEAYSSYHGFIEGALRSVDLAFPDVAEAEAAAEREAELQDAH